MFFTQGYFFSEANTDYMLGEGNNTIYYKYINFLEAPQLMNIVVEVFDMLINSINVCITFEHSDCIHCLSRYHSTA